MEWSWIDREAEVGPVLRVGPDVYERDQPGGRVLRLTTTYAPGVDYVEPAVAAFRAVAEAWGAPVLFVLEPDVKKPPAVRFLYEWSRTAWENGSVERSWFLMHNPLSRVVGNVVARAFCAGGMPFDAVASRAELDGVLRRLDLSGGRPDFQLAAPPTTALTSQRRLGEGAYGQLVTRLLRRIRG